MAGRGIDAILVELDGGLYDIAIGFDGDIATADAFDTAITVSLLTDARADPSVVLESHRRRGWVGNESTPGFEIGSLLWTFDQVRFTTGVGNAIADVARDALQWLVDDGHAVKIVSGQVILDGDTVRLEGIIERANSRVTKLSFDLWENTGA